LVDKVVVRMPLKIKKLKAALSKAGFYSRSAKGSHTLWRHPLDPTIRVALSGKDGDDAQQYQLDDVRNALRKVGHDL
jgi:predicted RNA binding protein YcfA (HicA-like mRNA interferase family)